MHGSRVRGAAIAIGTVAALAASAVGSIVGAQTPSTPPSPDPIVGGPLDPYLMPITVAVLALGALTLAAIRPGARRPIAAMLGLVMLGAGILFVVAAFLGDLSGQRRLNVGALALGIALIVAVVVGGIWFRRSGGDGPAGQPDSNSRTVG